MSTIIVNNLFGGDPAAAGTYVLQEDGSWLNGDYSFIWQYDISTYWALVKDGDTLIEESLDGTSDTPASATSWDKYSVRVIESPSKLPIGSGSSSSISSPGTLNPVSPGVPDRPENYVGTFEQSLTLGQKAQAIDNIGLGNVDNTSDADKPVSTLQAAADAAVLAAALAADGIASSPTTLKPSKFEVWLKIGQSNAVGTDSGAILAQTLDAPDPRVFEFSQGLSKSTYRATPAGTIQILRNPAQDDTASIGFSQIFGKTRVALNPSIEKLIIVNRAVGSTGFSTNHWNPGDSLYNAAVADVKLCLETYPDAVFKGILWHQGETDSSVLDQAAYEAALSAMVAGMRSEIYGGEKSVFILGTMSETYIQTSEALKRRVDLAHRRVAEYIDYANFVDFSDLDTAGNVHFTTDHLRIMGARYGTTVQAMLAPVPYPKHRFEVVDGAIFDSWGGATAPSLLVATDGTRGDVIDTNATGSQTDAFIRGDQYTKALWVNLIDDTGNPFSNLVGGQAPTNVGGKHFFAQGGFGHAGSLGKTLNTELAAGTWTHIALTFKNNEFRLYVDGVADGSNPYTHLTNAEDLINAIVVEIGTLNGNGTNAADALLDKITILPYALSDAGVLSLYNRELI